jgi:putative Mn2+ efflux pump MntP
VLTHVCQGDLNQIRTFPTQGEFDVSWWIFLVGIVLGLDSFAVGMGLGMLFHGRDRRFHLALALAVCDGLATLVSSTAAVTQFRSAFGWSEWFGPATVAVYGLGVFVLARHCQKLTPLAAARWVSFILPVGLAFDNLIAGCPSAPAIPAGVIAVDFGATSGAMAFAGMACGSFLRAGRPVRAWRLGGVMLIAVAAGLMLKEAVFNFSCAG